MILRLFGLFILQVLVNVSVYAEGLRCERYFPEKLHVNNISACNQTVVNKMPAPDQVGKVRFNNLLFSSLINANNLGGVKVHLPNGDIKVVYRSAYLASSPLCLQALTEKGVKTVVNLFSEKLAYAPKLQLLESAIFYDNGGEDYRLIDHYNVTAKKPNFTAMNQKIKEVVGKITSAKGDVLIHCVSGEHRTGVIFGVLNKCFNHQDMGDIEKNSTCHMNAETAYGKKVQANVLGIIRQFPCESLGV